MFVVRSKDHVYDTLRFNERRVIRFIVDCRLIYCSAIHLFIGAARFSVKLFTLLLQLECSTQMRYLLQIKETYV